MLCNLKTNFLLPTLALPKSGQKVKAQHPFLSQFIDSLVAIIFTLTIIVVISIKITQYQESHINDNRYRQAVHFIEVVAEDLKTDKENIYINTSASIDGALVRIGTLYFRVISGDNGENYLLEKIDLENPKVELIEVRK